MQRAPPTQPVQRSVQQRTRLDEQCLEQKRADGCAQLDAGLDECLRSRVCVCVCVCVCARSRASPGN